MAELEIEGIGSIWRHKFAVWIIGFIQKPNYLGHMTILFANHIVTNKSSANREMPLFSHIYPSFGYLRKMFPPRGLKCSLFLNGMVSNSSYCYLGLPCCPVCLAPWQRPQPVVPTVCPSAAANLADVPTALGPARQRQQLQRGWRVGYTNQQFLEYFYFSVRLIINKQTRW